MHSSAKISILVGHALLLASAALTASTPADGRPLDPENTLYLELASGQVVIELAHAHAHAPLHVADIRILAHAEFFNGLSIVRVQDDYVVRWRDPGPGNELRPASVLALTRRDLADPQGLGRDAHFDQKSQQRCGERQHRQDE